MHSSSTLGMLKKLKMTSLTEQEVTYEKLKPWRDLLCALIEQAAEDAKGFRVFKRDDDTADSKRNYETARTFIESKFFIELTDTLGLPGTKIRNKLIK